MSARVSVVVPARSLTDAGRRCLGALLALPERPEVIFVPDAPEPGLPSRVVSIPSGPLPPGRKRQLGLERASGELVGFLDDDAFPAPGWLAAAAAELEADAQLAAVCGPILSPPGDDGLGGRVLASPLVSGPVRWRYTPLPARDVDDAPGGNVVVRRADGLAAGIASDFFPGDDTEASARLTALGKRIRYVPDAVVYHDWKPLWRPYLRGVWRYSRHRGSFARRGDPSSRRLSYAAPSAVLLGLAAGPFLPARARPLWQAGALGYAAACAAAGISISRRRPWVGAAAVAATHAVYGTGFLAGLAGVRLPEERP
ncbi:MAG TPA: glycosyltransferase [Gaiellaceae bacterium]|nr:glycosyltransferase [Gaiellaceae bacterium]